MKKVYFVRHGQTDGNAGNITHGPNEPLNEKGKEQARITAQRFATIPVECLIASPWPRAKATAQSIAEVVKHDIVFSDLFVERNFPTVMYDKPYRDPQSVLIAAEMSAHMHDPSWHYSDEENFFDTRERARKAIAFLEACPETSIAVVSHGMFIRYILATMMDPHMEPSEFQKWNHFFKSINTGITYCAFDENDEFYTGWRLMTWNDHAHLGELSS